MRMLAQRPLYDVKQHHARDRPGVRMLAQRPLYGVKPHHLVVAREHCQWAALGQEHSLCRSTAGAGAELGQDSQEHTWCEAALHRWLGQEHAA